MDQFYAEPIVCNELHLASELDNNVLVVTNTIPMAEKKRAKSTIGISTVSVAKLFADAIFAIHTGRSISRLFT